MKGQPIEQKIDAVVAVLVKGFNPDKIILFGSAAWGELTPDSDVDFLIIKSDVPGRGIDRQILVDRLVERNGLALDMLVMKPEEMEEGLRQGDPFIAEIVKRGKVLYG